MNPEKPRSRSPWILLAPPLIAAALLSSCVTVRGGKEGRNDRDAAAALRAFAAAVETLDPDKVAAFYAKDAFSEVLVRAPRHTTGWKALREDVARTLAPVAAVHAQPVGDVRAWRDGDHAWTVQDFQVGGTLKDGRGFSVDVSYSAVWRKIDKKWFIEYEHFLGPRPVPKTTPPNPS